MLSKGPVARKERATGPLSFSSLLFFRLPVGFTLTTPHGLEAEPAGAKVFNPCQPKGACVGDRMSPRRCTSLPHERRMPDDKSKNAALGAIIEAFTYQSRIPHIIAK